MMQFATPLAFLLFLPWAYAVYRMLRHSRSQALPFPALSMVPTSITWRQRISTLPPLLLALGSAALIVAAARPQSMLSKSRKSTEAIAIEMTVDISGSMMALDFTKPGAPPSERKTRLDVVKETFAEFVKHRPDDLIGLVAFGGYATTRCPLTLDHTALLHVLSAVKVPGQDGEPADQMESMTAIGDGLAMACARLASVTNVETRIVILLSDGESNAGIITPEQATALAKQQGVKVYTIGVGTTGLADAIGKDMFGREFIGKMEVHMDEAELKRIAKETDGLYFNVMNKDALERALEEINKLQKTSIDATVYSRYKEHFLRFLIPGLIAVVLALILTTKSRRSLI